MENASRRYGYAQVKHLIERQRERGWEFVFIGANIDVAAEAERLGIDADRAVGYVHDEVGTGAVYRAASCAVRATRADMPLAASGLALRAGRGRSPTCNAPIAHRHVQSNVRRHIGRQVDLVPQWPQ